MIKVNAKLLAAVSIAQSTDSFSTHLKGVHFDGETIVATDGHVMTVARDSAMRSVDKPITWHISKAAFSAMKKTKADSVTIDENECILQVFDAAENPLYMERIEIIHSIFPNYVRVCPQNTGEVCPGTFLTPVIDKLVQTAKVLSGNKPAQMTLTGEGRYDPHLVRYASDDIFSVAMPAVRRNSIEMPKTYPAWFKR